MNGGVIAAMMGMMTMNKEILFKAIRCSLLSLQNVNGTGPTCIELNGNKCAGCQNYQLEYDDTSEVIQDLYRYAMTLEKSNRNWRRKCQRLRAKIADEDLAQ